MKYVFSVYSPTSQRVDIYLSTLFSQFSRSYVQKLIDRKQVTINQKSISKNIKIHHKDKVTLELLIESSDILAEDIHIDVIYEDAEILIINKNAGINTHPTPWIEWKAGTLVNAILYHCGNSLPIINGKERPWIVHRLDKNTSGAIMVAKTDTMMQYLSGIIHDRKVEKYYVAVVAGIVTDSSITIESYIGRHPTDKTRMTTKNPINPKEARTHAEVLEYIDDTYSVLRVKLETGRTHQIRVHLASIGHPIVGDSVYGNDDVNRQVKQKYGITRQALHAYELVFQLYGKDKRFIAPLKEDMKSMVTSI